MVKGEKTNLYLLAIVAIVAVVGVVVLVMNSGAGSTSWSSSDYSGEAIKSGSLGMPMVSTIKLSTGKTASVVVYGAEECDHCDSSQVCQCNPSCKCV